MKMKQFVELFSNGRVRKGDLLYGPYVDAVIQDLRSAGCPIVDWHRGIIGNMYWHVDVIDGDDARLIEFPIFNRQHDNIGNNANALMLSRMPSKKLDGRVFHDMA